MESIQSGYKEAGEIIQQIKKLSESELNKLQALEKKLGVAWLRGITIPNRHHFLAGKRNGCHSRGV